VLTQTFESVLTAARAGGEWAWARIYDDLAPPVLGYLRARSAVDPEDLLGEVFLQVVRDLPTFDGDRRAFRAWVFTIAHHRLIDDARRRARRPADPVPPEHLGEALGFGDAEQEALARLGSDWARQLIARLPSGQQDALLLRIVADLSVDAIARVTGKRPGAVKALQRRALANLRKEISKEGASK
jgi:RNA polymerase sigma factor (sigma-70 family)